MHRWRWPLLCLPILLAASACGSDILMITMGGTKSHKMPFWELARGLIRRDHNITFISAFPADFHITGLEEIAPEGLVTYVRNYMSFDLVGARMRGEDQMPLKDVLRYGYEACDAFLSDPETRSFLRSGRTFDLVILDGTYPECALGIVYKLKVPFMYINTVGFYTMPLTNSGSPAPYSVTPFFGKAFTDNMGIFDRALNAIFHAAIIPFHAFSMQILQGVLRRNFGQQIPHVYDMAKNVSFILQNGHYSVSYPRPYLPNVAEVACIHCKEAKPLDPEIEEWISGAGETGFVYVSMGSSVRTTKMPLSAHRLLVEALGRLPQRVLWKQDVEQNMTDIPSNIRLYKWLPQQDLLGHPKIKAFVTHGGLLSMFETVYHGVPIVTIPIFCDHDSNAAKAEVDGYAKKLDLQHLTPEKLYKSILEVIIEPRYKQEVKKRQVLLRDQKETPLERAIYWTEYVIRHKGAYHLQSPAKDMNFFQYYSLDVFLLVISVLVTLYALISYALRLSFNRLIGYVQKKQMHQLLDKSNNLLTSSKLLSQAAATKKKL
ncbi:UDP-glucosyltransferase 2 [Spodoptera frugiperda]|uniref:UDP-glucosyltransferase 2 n=1 Tax=Spodoptera frugiperda TaxID=7108 RepID=A0A9R0D2D9_SPOFR|nr:UDP-glucosyltransferase 2 [Spodoptera frugiperda]XP_035437705.2 UDP-glucosyltransferase 2 [Spodoptera frugiperda]XP_035437706.2 UDP-glucosyltransferase 2 [Spodoptera frugiperda]